MFRGFFLFARLLRTAPIWGLLLTGVTPFALDHPVAVAQEGPALVVDDAATANAELVDVEVADPAGFGVSGETLQVPPGYTATVVAAGLGDPRFMDVDSVGNLLVGTARQGVVYRFPFTAGQLGEPEVLLSGLEQPASVALFTADDGEYLYVGEIHQVSRYRYDPTGPVGDQDVIIPNLPTGVHRTRTVAFGPDAMLYLAVGSSCNICLEEEPIRATVSRANPDGSDLEIIATGLRNPVGLAFQPGTDLLWATVNERDNQGNEIPPDLVTIVDEGANYGWPQCMPPDATPQETGAECSGVTPPTIGIQAHSAPLGLAFLDGEGVPERSRWRSHRGSAWLLEPGATGGAEAAADRLRGWHSRSRHGTSPPDGRTPAVSAGADRPGWSSPRTAASSSRTTRTGCSTGSAPRGSTVSTTIVFEIEPGGRLGLHTDQTGETQDIVSGTGELQRDDGIFPVGPGSDFVSPTNVRHDLVNTGTETLRAVGFVSAAMFTQTFDNVMQPVKSHVLGTPNRDG